MNVNVIIIGGGPAGIITALTAKSVYPEKSVCIIKEIGDSIIPCAIPYMMHTLSDPKQNAMGNMPLEKAGIDIIAGIELYPSVADIRTDRASIDQCGPSGLGEVACHHQGIATA